MFGLELWFLLAVLSALLGGIFIFTTKVAAERNYDIVLLSTVALVLSAMFTFSVVFYRGDFSGLGALLFFVVVLNAAGYMTVNILRHRAMQCIDTAVYYPLYKTLTPAIAIVAGLLFFSERFDTYEWIGLVLSLMVPLLLITHAEKERQKDLLRGLKLLVITAFFATFSAAIVKYGADVIENTWLFIALSDTATAGIGIAIMLSRNGKHPLVERLQTLKNPSFLWLAFWMGTMSATAYVALVFAFKFGTLGVVYTINSLYILIPIVLSIIYYHEHWNVRKVIAIILSIAALGLLK